MKIAIVASIYPPEIGGPAQYAKNLKEALERAGHSVVLVRYGFLKRFPSGIRHVLFAIKLLIKSYGTDAMIAFDTYSGGLPAVIVSVLTGRFFLIRIGGDFVWEMYIERTRDLVPLPDIYRRRDKWNWKERLSFSVSWWVLRRASVVFSSAWLLGIWKDVYKIDPSRVYVIENAIGGKIQPIAPARRNFIFYTRQIALKNAAAFKRAFAKAKIAHPEIELDEGMVPHDELERRMRECYAVVLPSISEVTPNYIIDAIRCGKPFLLTKYSGYAERFKNYGVIVDPLDEEEMARGIIELATPEIYRRLQSRISTFKESHTYDDIAREFVEIAEKN